MSNTSSATVEKPKEQAAPAPTKPVVEFEDDDLVTVLLRGWGAFDKETRQPLIRPDQETYLDRHTFIGGVGRNIPYEDAKRWVKLKLISKEHIFPDSAQADEFASVTGRNPLSQETLAGAIASLSPEKAAAILGDEAALVFAKNLQKLISSRARENND